MECSFKEKVIHTTEHSFGTVFEISKRLSCSVRFDDGKVIVNEVLLVLQKKNKIKKIVCYTSKGAHLANKVNKTLSDFLKKLLFVKNCGNWLMERNVIGKRFNKEKHSLTKLTPIHSFLEKIEGYVCQKKLEKKENQVP